MISTRLPTLAGMAVPTSSPTAPSSCSSASSIPSSASRQSSWLPSSCSKLDLPFAARPRLRWPSSSAEQSPESARLVSCPASLSSSSMRYRCTSGLCIRDSSVPSSVSHPSSGPFSEVPSHPRSAGGGASTSTCLSAASPWSSFSSCSRSRTETRRSSLL